MLYTITVKPNSKHEKLVVTDDNTITIWCNAKPIDNEANIAVIKLLSKHFHIPKTQIKIIRGATSRKKVIEIPG